MGLSCGSFPDLKIFFLYVRACLSPGESVIADKGYHAGCCVTLRNVLASYAKMHRTLRARQKTVNSKNENFFVLRQTFRHSHMLHAICFHAVAQLTAIMIEHSDPLLS